MAHSGPPLTKPLYIMYTYLYILRIPFRGRQIDVHYLLGWLQAIGIVYPPAVLNSERIEEAIGFTLTTIVFVNRFHGIYRLWCPEFIITLHLIGLLHSAAHVHQSEVAKYIRSRLIQLLCVTF